MRDYLTFESEFDRLKDIFLLEAEDQPAQENDDDLVEGNNESVNEELTEEPPADVPEASGDETEDKEPELTDLDSDSDLDEITGNPGDAPDPDKVNADDGAPGAINPKTLLQEMAQGEDNIYVRVVNAAKDRFPSGQCQVKDLLEPIAHAVKAFMKNKNYAPLPKEAMKAVCLNVAKTIHDKCMGKPATEAAAYTKRPAFEAGELMEGWKELLLAGGIAAGTAGAATAPSAPEATLRDTPRYMTVQQDAAQAQKKKNSVKTSSVPTPEKYTTVEFSKDSTYRMTPEEFSKYKAAGNLPEHYVITKDGTVDKEGSKQGVSGKGGSKMQGAVKAQAKSGKTTGELAKGGNGKNAGKSVKGNGAEERCTASEGNFNARGAAHYLGHKAVDAAIKGGSSVWGGLKGAAKGLVKGATDAWRDASKDIEKDHDSMIANRKH